MRKKDVLYFKNLLLNQKSSLLNKSSNFKTESQFGREVLPDDLDWASSELTLNLSIRLQERDRVLVQKIDSALMRIANNNYGLCELCQEPMNVKRLRARPVATLCISCKEDQEDYERVYA